MYIITVKEESRWQYSILLLLILWHFTFNGVLPTSVNLCQQETKLPSLSLPTILPFWHSSRQIYFIFVFKELRAKYIHCYWSTSFQNWVCAVIQKLLFVFVGINFWLDIWKGVFILILSFTSHGYHVTISLLAVSSRVMYYPNTFRLK